jgi:hypothetical protein
MTVLARLALLFALAAAAGSCDKSPSPAAPSGTFTSGPVQVETFSGTLAQNGFRFYSFPVTHAGTISLTLISLTAGGAPVDTNLRLTIGVPSGTDCQSEFTTIAPVRSSPQIQGFVGPGTYCARVGDVGTLSGTVEFQLNIAYPR